MRRLLLSAVLFLGCEPMMDFRSQLEVEVDHEALEVTKSFVKIADEAEHTLWVAFPELTDLEVAQALVKAWQRGVDVRVVTDVDQAPDPGVELLQEEGVPLRLTNDEITYFDFEVNRDVYWPSEQVVMSHAFAVADETQVVAADHAGGTAPGARVVLSVDDENLAEDVKSEHKQLFAGIDAAAMTAHSAPAKSPSKHRWTYGTATEHRLQLWFGPQDRLTKRVIDEVYRARASVWVLTDDLANHGLIRALEDKGQTGFDIQVVVGPRFGTTTPEISNAFPGLTPHVDGYQVAGMDHVPTVILVDYDEGRDGRHHNPRALILTHDLQSSARLHKEEEVVTDQLIDGSLWVVEQWQAPSGPLLDLKALYEAHLAEAEAL